MDIVVDVIHQKMHASITKDIAAGSQRFVKFKFNLDEDWNGLKIFAQFRQGGNAYNDFLDDDNTVYLPQEIEPGICYLMLYGSNNITIGTVNPLVLTINDNKLIADAKSTEITESLYNQLVTEFNQLKAQVKDFTSNDDIMANITTAVNSEISELNFLISDTNHLIVEYNGEPIDAGEAAVSILSINESTADNGYNVIEFSNGTQLKVKNGSKGTQGEKGDKGDAFTYDDLTDEQKAELKEGIEQCVADQTYSPTSENAQSGKAVAEAVSERISKIITEGHTVSFKRAIALQEGIAGQPLGADDEDYVTVDIAPYDTSEFRYLNGEIATYGNGGRLKANTPIDDFDCANKAYVDETAKETANDRIPKIAPASAPFLSVLTVNRSDADWNSDILNDTAFSGKYIDDTAVEDKSFVMYHGGFLVPRDPRGNLWTGEPVDDQDCVPYSMYKALLERVEALEAKT